MLARIYWYYVVGHMWYLYIVFGIPVKFGRGIGAIIEMMEIVVISLWASALWSHVAVTKIRLFPLTLWDHDWRTREMPSPLHCGPLLGCS